MVLKTRLRRIVFLIVGLLVILDCVGWDLVAEAQVANGRQNGGARMLIQAVQLDTKILGPKQVIIDVRSRPSYEMGHIPSAIWVDANLWREQSLRANGLQDAKHWSDAIGQLGIGRSSHVILYGDTLQNTARIWWLLRYMGCDDSQLLDGGWKAWESSGGAKESSINEPKSAKFDVAFQPDRFASLSHIQKDAIESKECQVLDNRTKDEFNGTAVRDGRAGHIPGAHNLDWTSLVDADGKFLSESDLRKKMESAGIDLARPVATHCQTGARSSVGAFALELITGKPARNYYRGWSEWGSNEGVLIEK